MPASICMVFIPYVCVCLSSDMIPILHPGGGAQHAAAGGAAGARRPVRGRRLRCGAWNELSGPQGCAWTRITPLCPYAPPSPARASASGSGHATTTRSNNSIAEADVVPRTLEHETRTLLYNDDLYAESTHSTCTAAESGLQLLERLWRALQTASAADAPLARWLFLGALRPWLAAARTWVFTASPAAPKARQTREHIRMPFLLQRTADRVVRVSLAFVGWSCTQDALWSVFAPSTLPPCFHAVRCSVNSAESA